MSKVAEQAAKRIAQVVRQAGVNRESLINDTLADSFDVALCAGPNDYPMRFALREVAQAIQPIIDAELEPLMEVLREALESRGQIHGGSCQSWADTVLTNEGCNCWVSRAQDIVREN